MMLDLTMHQHQGGQHQQSLEYLLENGTERRRGPQDHTNDQERETFLVCLDGVPGLGGGGCQRVQQHRSQS